ncbi:MAG TPA: rRNA maturation RNase YbeY [Burkholderiaceae bacterium]|nr:rRNA maturation RNase YbeY [Burkholderiaceae bacterium]
MTHAFARSAPVTSRKGRRKRDLELSIQGAAAFPALPSRTTLRRWTRLALGRDAVIVLRFVGTIEGRRLNREFRGQDHATNVLTFDYMETPVRADIVICVPVVRSEARAQGKPFRHHLLHLVIHGLLHAQGHDHVSPRQAYRMEARERRLLAHFHVPDPYA